MIRVNLLKKKRKPKPILSSVIRMAIVTAVTGIAMACLVFLFDSRLSAKKEEFRANEKKIIELKEKIKVVEGFEEVNVTIRQKKDIIKQLRKNQAAPVKLLDEISNLLPKGVWLQTMAVSGESIDIDGYASTNSAIVSYVDNLKNSEIFTEIYLYESRSVTVEDVPLYMFRLVFKMKV